MSEPDAKQQPPDKRVAEARQAEIDGLQRELDRLRQENESMGKRVRELQDEFAGAKLLHSKLIRDSQTREQRLSDLIRELQAELGRIRTEDTHLKSELERTQKEAGALRQEVEAVKGIRAELNAEKERSRALEEASKKSQSEAAAAGVAAAQERIRALEAENQRIQSQAKVEVEELRKKLGEAEKKPSGTPAEAAGMAAAQERIRALEAENQRLATEVAQLQSAAKKPRPPIRARVIQPKSPQGPVPPEVRQPGDLWEGAAPLNQHLRQAARDKVGIAERDAAAQTSQLGELLARLKFEKGKYAVQEPEESRLESVLSQQSEPVYYLVVGYASLPGCKQQNETLSRRRAEAVSAAVRKRLKPGAQVQSMYFGETDQFDSEREEENQVVEIWKVGP